MTGFCFFLPSSENQKIRTRAFAPWAEAASPFGGDAPCNKGLLLVKKFDDLPSPETKGGPAPGEAEIQVYVNRGKTFIELEAQGAYTTLKPHEALSWTVRWYLLPVADSAEPSAELMKNVKM